MRHGKKGKKFHRMRGQRQAFIRSLANALIRHGSIETTEARAKAIRPVVEHYVTMAKKQDLAHRRLLISRLHNESSVRRLFDEWGKKYAERKGGYLRVVKGGKARKRDGTRLAVVEFV